MAENPLVFLIGTPPRPNDEGDIFRIRRDEALSGNGDGILWVEFGVDDGVETLEWTRETIDWFQVAKANPSFPHRVNKTAIRRLVKNLGSDDSSWWHLAVGGPRIVAPLSGFDQTGPVDSPSVCHLIPGDLAG